LNQNKEVLHSRPVFFARERDGIAVEVALQYNDSYIESVHSFVNNINAVEGGTHLIGFRAALTRPLPNSAEREGLSPRATRAGTRRRARGGGWRAARPAWTEARCPASSPTARWTIRGCANSTSSRATRRAAPRSRAATADSRPSCRSAARS